MWAGAGGAVGSGPHQLTLGDLMEDLLASRPAGSSHLALQLAPPSAAAATASGVRGGGSTVALERLFRKDEADLQAALEESLADLRMKLQQHSSGGVAASSTPATASWATLTQEVCATLSSANTVLMTAAASLSQLPQRVRQLQALVDRTEDCIAHLHDAVQQEQLRKQQQQQAELEKLEAEAARRRQEQEEQLVQQQTAAGQLRECAGDEREQQQGLAHAEHLTPEAPSTGEDLQLLQHQPEKQQQQQQQQQQQHEEEEQQQPAAQREALPQVSTQQLAGQPQLPTQVQLQQHDIGKLQEPTLLPAPPQSPMVLLDAGVVGPQASERGKEEDAIPGEGRGLASWAVSGLAPQPLEVTEPGQLGGAQQHVHQRQQLCKQGQEQSEQQQVEEQQQQQQLLLLLQQKQQEEQQRQEEQQTEPQLEEQDPEGQAEAFKDVEDVEQQLQRQQQELQQPQQQVQEQFQQATLQPEMATDWQQQQWLQQQQHQWQHEQYYTQQWQQEQGQEGWQVGQQQPQAGVGAWQAYAYGQPPAHSSAPYQYPGQEQFYQPHAFPPQQQAFPAEHQEAGQDPVVYQQQQQQQGLEQYGQWQAQQGHGHQASQGGLAWQAQQQEQQQQQPKLLQAEYEQVSGSVQADPFDAAVTGFAGTVDVSAGGGHPAATPAGDGASEGALLQGSATGVEQPSGGLGGSDDDWESMPDSRAPMWSSGV